MLNISNIQRVMLILMLFYSLSVQAAGNYLLTSQQWAIPRSATTVLVMPAMHHVMRGMSKDSMAQLVILYPGGEEGILWAHDVKGWLISLGISSRRIEIQPGSRNPQILEFKINPGNVSAYSGK